MIPDVENDASKSAPEMKIPNQYVNTDWGKKTKLVTRKVTSRGADGQIYGSKTIVTKEGAGAQPTFLDHLLHESDELTILPSGVIAELKKNIRAGAKDLAQQWKNTLELVHKAYQVARIRTPVPTEKGAWKQYEELIHYGVRQLSATRGLNGNWRSATVLVREADDAERHIGKRRFFVELPGERAQEVDADDLDEIIEAISNKIRNSRHVTGTKVRIEERQKKHAILTVWVNDIKRERIIIREVS